MKTRFSLGKSYIALTALLIVSGGIANAQPPQGPPPEGGPGGPGGPRGRMGGPRGRGMTILEAPADILQVALKLSDAQKSKIAEIQRNFHEQRRNLMPPPPEEGAPPPDREAMRENMEKMRELGRKSTGEIMTLLSNEQKQALPPVMKDVDALRIAGIPLEIYGNLKLSNTQTQKLIAIGSEFRSKMRPPREGGNGGPPPPPHEGGNEGPPPPPREGGNEGPPPPPRGRENGRREVMEKTNAVLTEAQREMVKKWHEEHPRPPFAGPGGPEGGPEGNGYGRRGGGRRGAPRGE